MQYDIPIKSAWSEQNGATLQPSNAVIRFLHDLVEQSCQTCNLCYPSNVFMATKLTVLKSLRLFSAKVFEGCGVSENLYSSGAEIYHPIRD
jgi:hypothetical protein